MSSKSNNNKNSTSSDKASPIKGEDRTSLMKIIGKAIGLDITKISIPVKYNEPFSFLQKMMEYLQYTDLLEEASQSEDPKIRALLVTIFSISCFANTWRTAKPFNPLLGETFEYEDSIRQLRFIAEQVSHHPPVGASHCETPSFVYSQTQEVKTKFLGNSLDVTPKGSTSVVLKKWDECYTWSNIRTVVNNLILGKMWIDHFGKISTTVCKNSSGETLPIDIHLDYKKCGWFGRGWRDVKGKVLFTKKKVFNVSGKWNEEVYVTVDPSFTKNIKYSKIDFDDNSPQLIWKHRLSECNEKKFRDYGWSNFTEQLTKLNDQLLYSLPLSDSRLREDIVNLENENIKLSSKSKNDLEDAQRSRKKSLMESNEVYKPRYFDFIDSKKCYKYNDKYWNERAKRTEEKIRLDKKASIQDAKKFWMMQSHEIWYNTS